MAAYRTKDAYEFVDVDVLDGKTAYLTDARRVGVMLRDKRLTLRGNAALSEFLFESVGDNNFIMKSLDMGDEQNAYVRFGDKDALSVDASRDRAEKVQVRVTELGLVLYVMDGLRPGVYDHFHDVSIGKPEKGRSTIFILVHLDGPTNIYAPFNAVGGGVDADDGALGDVDMEVPDQEDVDPDSGALEPPLQEEGPGQIEPSFPGQTQPSYPGGIQPSYPGQVQPSYPGGIQPSYPGGIQSSYPGQVQPSSPGYERPATQE